MSSEDERDLFEEEELFQRRRKRRRTQAGDMDFLRVGFITMQVMICAAALLLCDDLCAPVTDVPIPVPIDSTLRIRRDALGNTNLAYLSTRYDIEPDTSLLPNDPEAPTAG